MKLDLLYEIDVPRPWGDKPHPYGQREAEQEAYREAMEQMKLADRLGFNTAWVVEHHFREGRSHCPSSEVVLGALFCFGPPRAVGLLAFPRGSARVSALRNVKKRATLGLAITAKAVNVGANATP